MTDLKVVPFTIPVTLMDIPGRLREHAKVMDGRDSPRTLLIVELDHEGVVSTYCFGDNPNRCETIGMLRLASRRQENDQDGI